MRAPAVFAAWLALALAGCASIPAPAYQSGIENTGTLLDQRTVAIGVGSFAAAPGVENKRLSVRGLGISSPSKDGNFSGMLQEALVSELQTAGRYDPKSATQVSGTLLGNELHAASASTGRARMQARFIVTRDGAVVYDKVLDVDHDWPSSFLGVIAAQSAMENYVGTVQRLLGKLFSDPDFQKAVLAG